MPFLCLMMYYRTWTVSCLRLTGGARMTSFWACSARSSTSAGKLPWRIFKASSNRRLTYGIRDSNNSIATKLPTTVPLRTARPTWYYSNRIRNSTSWNLIPSRRFCTRIVSWGAAPEYLGISRLSRISWGRPTPTWSTPFSTACKNSWSVISSSARTRFPSSLQSCSIQTSRAL